MNRSLALSVTLSALTACSAAGGGGGMGKADLSSEDAKTFYALGVSIGQNLARGALSGVTPDQVSDVQTGIGDALMSRTPQVDMPTYGPKIQALMQQRQGMAQAAQKVAAGDEKKKGDAFAETAAKEAGAQKLPSGLVFKELTPGTGATPVPTDTVKVNYEGKLIDGTVFDGSDKHSPPGPTTFQLNRVIPCWTEGVQKLKVGGKAQLVCPASIAYGDTGHPPTIPGGSTLIFTVELLDIVPKQPMPPGGAPSAMAGPHPPMGMQGRPGAMGPGSIQVHPMTPPPAAPAPAPTH